MGGVRDMSPYPGSKFFQYHAVLGKIFQNHMLATPPPPEGWRPNRGEILDPPLKIEVLFDAISSVRTGL